MALPTGRNAALLSARAKANKAAALLHELKLDKLSNKAFELFTLVDAELAKSRKPKHVRGNPETDEEINEGDDSAD